MLFKTATYQDDHVLRKLASNAGVVIIIILLYRPISPLLKGWIAIYKCLRLVLP
jgi:hypothetical protein